MAERASNGIVVGIVKSLEDPDKLGRIQVTYPHLGDQKSDWARLVSPMAGKNRGMFFRPEVDDEVLVAFEHCDPRRPYILGSCWSQADPHPTDDNKAKENNWRFIRSRSGHIIKFDDTKGSEKIEIVDMDGSRKVIIDSSGKKIQVICGQGDVEVKADAGNVKVEAAQSIEIKADNIMIKATGDMTLEATGTLTIKGATVNIN